MDTPGSHFKRILPCKPGWAGMLLLATFCLVARTCSADEALLLDGRGVAGQLAARTSGELYFVPSDKTSALELTSVDHVRLSRSRRPYARIPVVFRVSFGRNEHLSGVLLGLDQNEVRLKTTWKEVVRIPRSLTQSISHEPGYRAIVHEDFETGVGGWKLSGPGEVARPATAADSGRLQLGPATSSAQRDLPCPLSHGKFGIDYQLPAEKDSTRWLIEALLGKDEAGGGLHVSLAGVEGIHQGGLRGSSIPSAQVRSTPGWHRLVFELFRHEWAILIDDEVLWRGEPPVGKAIHRIRISSSLPKDQQTSPGTFQLDDFSVALAMAARSHPKGDPHQDEAWLADGDQLFGTVSQLDSRIVHLQSALTKRGLPWSEIRGVYLKGSQGEKPAAAKAKSEVRISIDSGCTLDNDQLVVTTTRLSDRQLHGRHRILGDIVLERSRIRRIKPQGGD